MSRFVSDDLIVVHEGEHRLRAGIRRTDGKLAFPFTLGPEASHYEPTLLPREGRVWSYTIQRFRPKPPFDGDADGPFQPFAVGYVELPGALIIESRLRVAFDLLHIGLPVRLTLEAYRHDKDGEDILTYAFEPTNDTRSNP